MMDKITEMTGSTNYVAPFIISDILLLITMITLCFVDGVRIIINFIYVALQRAIRHIQGVELGGEGATAPTWHVTASLRGVNLPFQKGFHLP